MLPFYAEAMLQAGFLWGLVLTTVGAACNAVMDAIARKWSLSVFSSIRGKWRKFFHVDSWKNKYVDWDGGDRRRVRWSLAGIEFDKPVQLTDAWHAAKSVMVCSLLGLFLLQPAFITWLAVVQYGILGAWWNVVFLSLYKVALMKRKT